MGVDSRDEASLPLNVPHEKLNQAILNDEMRHAIRKLKNLE